VQQQVRRLAILGATGSIGTQALEVVSAHPGLFEVEVLSAHKNAELLIAQARQFRPNAVVVTDEAAYATVKEALAGVPVKVFSGEAALREVVAWESVDLVLAGILGFAGLSSTLAALKAGKTVALANKESLVVAGELVMQTAFENKSRIIPVDSEHSAIFQCLMGENLASIEKVVLTASGGPFIGRKPNFLVNVKASHALQHPTWNMGAKITIDSATLMNKGLEMIEAKWLFGLDNDQLEVVVHPQSIVHSFVQFVDGSMKAQLGLPDMRLPIQYALAWPQRLSNDFKRFRFKDFPKLSFEEPDVKTFRNLQLAKDAMLKGGNAPCALNAANEVVVHAFLQNKVGFLEMSDIIEQVMGETAVDAQPDLEALVQTDAAARERAADLVKKSQLSTY
jgi:1-deoxy-D-xylulose-5-phosphate reductoisomerase